MFRRLYIYKDEVRDRLNDPQANSRAIKIVPIPEPFIEKNNGEYKENIMTNNKKYLNLNNFNLAFANYTPSPRRFRMP